MQMVTRLAVALSLFVFMFAGVASAQTGGGGEGGPTPPTPPEGVLFFDVQDAHTGQPLSAEVYGVRTNLTMFTENGRRGVASTNCGRSEKELEMPVQGCTDQEGFGYFWATPIWHWDEGTQTGWTEWVGLSDGKCLLEVYADNYLIGRREVYITDGYGDAGSIQIRSSPLKVKFTRTGGDLPQWGGTFPYSFAIVNDSPFRQIFTYYTMVEGPARTRDWVNRPHNVQTRAVVIAPGKVWPPRQDPRSPYMERIFVPGSLPNQGHICVRVVVNLGADMWSPISEAQVCAQKGSEAWLY